MIVSVYATKLTREIQAGIKNPSIDMTNKKALDKPYRHAQWQRRTQAEAK